MTALPVDSYAPHTTTGSGGVEVVAAEEDMTFVLSFFFLFSLSVFFSPCL